MPATFMSPLKTAYYARNYYQLAYEWQREYLMFYARLRDTKENQTILTFTLIKLTMERAYNNN